MQEQQEKKLLTVKDVSERLNIKVKTIYARVEAKEIPCFRIGGLIRFRQSDIDQWLENCRNGKQAETQRRKIRKNKRKHKMSADHLSKIITKTIDQITTEGYTPDHGKPDQIRDLGKEVTDGSI